MFLIKINLYFLNILLFIFNINFLYFDKAIIIVNTKF